jgi:hypothetical protein
MESMFSVFDSTAFFVVAKGITAFAPALAATGGTKSVTYK